MAKTKEPKPDKTPEQNPVDIQNDEHRGMGGSYVFDPETGKRTRRVEGPAGPELYRKPTIEDESAESFATENVNEGQ